MMSKKIEQYVWDIDISSLPKWKRTILIVARILLSLTKDLADGQLSLRAMSLVYSTVISLVPLLAISFSVLKGFGGNDTIKPMLLSGLEPLGEKRFEITEKIVEFVDNIQIGILGALGISLLIYSVISMMHKIEISFNFVWKIEKERTFSQRFSDYLSVLLLGPLMIFLSMGITTTIQANIFDNYISGIGFLEVIVDIFGFIVPYFIMAAAFGFIYFYMPNTKVNIKSAFIGGFITAIIWKTMGVIFTAFVASSSQQTAIYSAFASIIIFMVWIYLAWFVLLIGASISYYHQNLKQMSQNKRDFVVGSELKEKLSLAIIYLIAKTYSTQKPKYDFDGLVIETNFPSNIVKDIINILIDSGYIIQTKDKKYYPAKPLEDLLIKNILHDVRSHNSQKVRTNKRDYNKIIDNFFNRSQKVLDKELGQVSIKNLIDS